MCRVPISETPSPSKERKGESLAGFHRCRDWRRTQTFQQLPKDDEQREKNRSRDNSWVERHKVLELWKKKRLKRVRIREEKMCRPGSVNNPLRVVQQLHLLVPFCLIVLSLRLRLSHFPLECPCSLITTALTAPLLTCSGQSFFSHHNANYSGCVRCLPSKQRFLVFQPDPSLIGANKNLFHVLISSSTSVVIHLYFVKVTLSSANAAYLRA